MNINSCLLASSVLGTIGSILIALLVLLLTITIHEFGHYLAGKILKFRINEFSIGMGPALYKREKKDGELFSIRLLPLGGYCAFEGEDDSASEVVEGKPIPKGTAFNENPPWKRIIVLVAGGIFNLLLAVVLIMLNFGIYGHFSLQAYEMRASDATDSLSGVYSEYSLIDEDIIVTLNGKYLYLTTDIADAISGGKKGDIVPAVVLRNGEKVDIQIMLRENVTAENINDLSGVFKALGIASVPNVETSEGSLFTSGTYLLRFDDNENYSESTRIYDSTSFAKSIAGYQSGDSVKVWVSTTEKETEELKKKNETDGTNLPTNRKLVTIVFNENWTIVDKTDTSAVLNYLNIDKVSLTYQMYSENVRLSFGECIYRSFVYAYKTIGVTFRAVGQLFSGSLPITSLSGPVSTISLTSQYVSYGLNYLLEIAAFIGISVGIFNLLPIPALDGGRVVFVIIEWIRKKPINRKVEAMIHNVGIIVLLLFAVLVDVIKLF